MASQQASCPSNFSWMKNKIGHDPCTVAAWLITLCVDPTSKIPATIPPIANGLTGYATPNATSGNACTCSWAFYNTIEACTVCQDSSAQDYSSWSSTCDTLGQTSTTTYWKSSVSFSNHTQLSRWSILNPSNWSSGTFNVSQAEEIANQNLPDVTDASSSQPTIASSSASSSTSSDSDSAGSKKTNAGAIAGGVVGGILALLAAALALWFFLVKRRGLSHSRRRAQRQHVDLNAEPDGDFLRRSSSIMEQSGNNPLAGHLSSQSVTYSTKTPTSPTSPMSYNPTSQHQQQGVFQGYPARSQTFPPPTMMGGHPNFQGQGPVNAVVGITHTPPRRTSRESIPTVAEQLDEKKRIRAEQQLQRIHSSLGYTSAVTRTATSSRTNSMDELNSGSQTLSNNNNNNSSNTAVSISQAISRSLTHSGTGSNGTSSGSPSPLDPDKRAKYPRRLSLKNPPWIKRRTVMNLNPDADLGSDDGNAEQLPIPTTNVAPLPLGGRVAAAGETTTPGDVIAAVPGARLPNARDRENPPPEYTSTPSS